MEFDDILNKYRNAAHSKSDLGTKFEELIARYLLTDPVYAPKLEWVKPWNQFHARKDLGGHDTGIDLVAKARTGGEFWAIQCKCYEEGHSVSKKDVDTFLSTSGRKFKDTDGKEVSFSQRYLIATTEEWSQHALDATADQIIPVVLINLRILREAPVDWEKIEQGVHGADARQKRHELMDHQRDAVDKAAEHFKKNDRGKLIMACGTGKTFTSLKIVERLLKKDGNKSCVLFLAPSISLVGQALRSWTAQSEEELNTICVCSDPKVTKKYAEDDQGERIEDLGAPATTDPEKIISQYREGKGTTAIFSTYQSIDSVKNAQGIGLPSFDVVICDEAHRTTGVIFEDKSESAFTKIHDNKNVKAERRVYMTATPRLYGVKGKEDAKKESVALCSMDDETIYGKEFYKISFGEAVKLDLLSDYKVLILTVDGKNIPEIVKRHWTANEKEIDADTDCKIWGCMNALAKNIAKDDTLSTVDPEKMRSGVMFCRTIKRSVQVCKRFNELAQMPVHPIDLEARHIDGSMNSMERDKLLGWLKDDKGICNVLSNVRCLSEGVDVPALDAVMFMDSKGSLIDIVQSVGRVMRKSPGKKYGYIVVPIVVPDDEDPETALDDNERYKLVWQVLRALRSHDERIDAEINTLQWNKSGKSGRGHIIVSYPSDFDNTLLSDGQYTLDDFEGALMARLVLKVGDREYIENWAKDVAEIMPRLMERLTSVCMHEEHGYKQYRLAFKRYLKGLKDCINDDVSDDDAVKMLAQQIITKPIFTALFGDDKFVKRNSVSQTIDAMLSEIDAKNGLKDIDLSEFYKGVEHTLTKIETLEGKQRVITSLYEKFFKNAFPKDQTINGIVYTPQEIVDFILRSATEVLKQEFDLDMSSENVNILDPFTGTGTFIARLIESGMIFPKDLERKYRNELFANEITLLAYYIAAVNIENTFTRAAKNEEYIPFENIVLTDTFNMDKICRGRQSTLIEDEYFKKNIGHIKKENNTPITIIVGNPPYGANQKSANDDAKKRTYRNGVDGRIETEYLDDSLFDGKKGNVNSVYDNYVRAFRWSTDRIGNNNGIIAFVTPNGWLTGSAFVGFRKRIEKEFSKIYVFNLRGDQNGQNWKEEGEKVFGQGSKIGISITLLVKRKGFGDKAKIFYTKTKDYMKRHEKFDLLSESGSFHLMEKNNSLEKLNIKDNGDWIVERDARFQTLIPLAGDTHKKFDKHDEKTIFVGYSRGFCTSRDLWAYNFSKNRLTEIKTGVIKGYSEQLDVGRINYNDCRVKWTTPVKKNFDDKRRLPLDVSTFTIASHRPFVKKWLDYDLNFNEAPYQLPRMFPAPSTKNLLICVSSIGDKKEFSCTVTNQMTDLHIVGTTQCFPLYWYEDSGEKRSKMKTASIDGTDASLVRHDGISDHALKLAMDKYGRDVTKEDIFYYVYGYLHSPDYRSAFSEDLKLSLPRIGFVNRPEDFRAFSKAGRELAELHLNYEDVRPPDSVVVSGNREKNSVNKMKLIPEERRIVYNQYITIENIPETAFEYVVNGRSALGWIVDQYQYSKDEDFGIVNDPNEYAGGEYILNLVLSVIGVSVRTMDIMRSLPKLDLGPVSD